ncbi:GlcNAc-transferase family protein [Rhizobium sp. ZPR3]|uniref:GlcNAc-transferase family protein n=2 Tax=unclassified Rhizobium TaxID=2613769 RepID=A0AAU7SS34_9HYPH
MNKARIFISIAGFCDPMLNFTVKSAIEKARFPDRLRFGIVDQSISSSESSLPAEMGQVAYLHVHPHHSRGVSWARALAMTLYLEEDYFLQIDSHTCFDRNWDVTLIDTLETISRISKSSKVIVSTRPFGFELQPDGNVRKKRFTACTLKLVPKSNVIRLSDPVVLFACENSNEMIDIPGFQISAAFLFTRGYFVEEIPYDPYMYFHGEEQNVSIRAFTHGWDIWHPNRLPLYHLYKKRSGGEPPLHWDKAFDDERVEKWHSMRVRANERLGELLNGSLGRAYSTGTTRTIKQYLELGSFTIQSSS